MEHRSLSLGFQHEWFRAVPSGCFGVTTVPHSHDGVSSGAERLFRSDIVLQSHGPTVSQSKFVALRVSDLSALCSKSSG